MPQGFVDGINFVASIASLLLAVVSVLLAIYFFIKSKEAEKETTSLLVKTEQQVSLMERVTTKMLDKYVDYSTKPRQNDEMTNQLFSLVQASIPSGGQALSSADVESSEVSVDLVTTYIATMYWSGIANVALQDRLPEDPAQLVTPDYSSYSDLLRSTKSDFLFARNWLLSNGGALIQKSSAANYYQQAVDISMASNVFTANEVYANRAATQSGES